MMNFRVACLTLAFVAFPLYASQAEQVNGTATYLQRIALSPNAVFEAHVEDVSRADARAESIDSVRISGPGNPPIRFAIDIDPQRIDERHRYSVRATITVEGRLLFTTDQSYPVLTQGNGREVELLLRQTGSARSESRRAGLLCARSVAGEFQRRFALCGLPWHCATSSICSPTSPSSSARSTRAVIVLPHTISDRGSCRAIAGHSTLHGEQERPLKFRVIDQNTLRKLDLDGHDIESALNYSLARMGQFEAIEPHLTMRGMYRYLADAGTFTECLTRQRWPVAQEDDNAALEREYLKVRRDPGEELMVSVEGHVKILPPMEGTGRRPTLVVTHFIGVWPGETCGARFATSDLQNTYWKLTALNGKPIFVADQQREPSLVLHSDNYASTGSGGCNRLMGSYEVNGNELHFGQACRNHDGVPTGMDTEKDFLATLTAGKWLAHRRGTPRILRHKRHMLGRFEARALR